MAKQKLRLILEAIDKTKKVFVSINKSLSSLNAKVSKSSKSMSQSIGTSFDKMKSRASAAFASIKKNWLALAAVIGGTVIARKVISSFIKEAASLESAMAELSKVFSGNEKELANLRDGASDLAIKYGSSVNGVVEGMARFAGAGANMNDILLLQKGAMDSAIAGNLETAEASQFLLQVLSGLGLEFKDVSKIVDSVNAIENNFNVRQREMFEALSESSGAARNIGLSLEELQASLVPIIEVFGSGTEAGTAMSTILLRMFSNIGKVNKKTGEFTNEFEKLGVTLKEDDGSFRNFLDILKDLSKIWPSLTDVQKQNVLTNQIGIRGAKQFSFVINDFNKVLDAHELALKSTGSAQVEVDKILGTSAKQWDSFVESTRALKIAIGKELIPVLIDLLPVFKELVPILKGVGTVIQGLVAAFKGFAGVVSDAFAIITRPLGGIESILRTFGLTSSTFFERLTDGFKETSNELLSEANQSLVKAGEIAKRAISEVKGAEAEIIQPARGGTPLTPTEIAELRGGIQAGEQRQLSAMGFQSGLQSLGKPAGIATRQPIPTSFDLTAQKPRETKITLNIAAGADSKIGKMILEQAKIETEESGVGVLLNATPTR